jgi:hypothetical protein
VSGDEYHHQNGSLNEAGGITGETINRKIAT